MQCEEFRRLMGHGEDSDLIAGYARLRQQIASARPDVVIVFDSHWFTTGYHLVDACDRYEGTYVSDEMPWYLHGISYKYVGHPDLAYAIEAVARENEVKSRTIAHPGLGRTYATLNLVKHLHFERLGLPVVSVSSCQNCAWPNFLRSGEVIGQAVARSNLRVLLLASGALSHRFNDLDWTPNHPRIYDESNVSSAENVMSDKRALAFFQEGRHDRVLDAWQDDFRLRPWEAFGAHYLQMVGALGGRTCRAKARALSAYENARGTGNIHLWFDVEREAMP
jgi:aromatic ring-opening dioxygenase catalytic subunit (LigB family)